MRAFYTVFTGRERSVHEPRCRRLKKSQPSLRGKHQHPTTRGLVIVDQFGPVGLREWNWHVRELLRVLRCLPCLLSTHMSLYGLGSTRCYSDLEIK